MEVIKVLELTGNAPAIEGQFGTIDLKIEIEGKVEGRRLLMPYEVIEQFFVNALEVRRDAFEERLETDESERPLNSIFFITDKLLLADTTPEGHVLTFSTNAGDAVALRIPKGELTTIIKCLQKLDRRWPPGTVLQ